MSAVNVAIGQGQGRSHETHRRKAVKEGAGKGNVKNAVQCAHLVKSYLFRCKAMHFGFAAGQEEKAVSGKVFGLFRKL